MERKNLNFFMNTIMYDSCNGRYSIDNKSEFRKSKKFPAVEKDYSKLIFDFDGFLALRL